jgi:hypothetical protein
VVCGLLLTICGGNACAALGQAPSVYGVSALVSTPAVQSGVYRHHRTQLENGTTIDEYSMSAGSVFAVAWRGPVLPDLQILLGSYFEIFKATTEQTRASGVRGGPVTVDRDDLVLNSNGRMRNFFGYAYLPALVPGGVNIKDVLP